MIRMTLALSLAIYGGLVIWGDPVTEAAAGPQRSDTDAAVAAALASGPGSERPVILAQARAAGPDVTRAAVSRVVVPAAAAIAADAPRTDAIGTPRLVSLVAPVDAGRAGLVPASMPADGPALLRVSGDRVNMRSGPSTANGVVASLPAGTLAEPLGAPAGGWVEIRVVDTGETGFMAARFLDPA